METVQFFDTGGSGGGDQPLFKKEDAVRKDTTNGDFIDYKLRIGDGNANIYGKLPDVRHQWLQ